MACGHSLATTAAAGGLNTTPPTLGAGAGAGCLLVPFSRSSRGSIPFFCRIWCKVRLEATCR